MNTWNEMSARERDRLVAEKLFGWQERPCDLDESGAELTIYDSGNACCPRCGAYGHINSFEHEMLQPAHYTTDLNAAWKVVEKFRGATLYALLPCATYYKTPKMRYSAKIYKDSDYKGGEALTESMPEAICLAALRAIGYEIEKEVPGGTNKES